MRRGRDVLARPRERFDSAKLDHVLELDREERSSNAEVDYVIAAGATIVPAEAKYGTRGQLTSLRRFLDARGSVAPYGIRFSTHPFSALGNLHSYPLYAVALFACGLNETVKSAIRSLR